MSLTKPTPEDVFVNRKIQILNTRKWEIKRLINKSEPDETWFFSNGIEFNWEGMQLAVLMANQELMNRNLVTIYETNELKTLELFHEVVVEVVKEVWKRLKCRKWIGIQSMSAPVSYIFSSQNGNICLTDMAAKTRMLKTFLTDKNAPDAKTLVQYLAPRLAAEIDEEVTIDLLNNHGTSMELTTPTTQKIFLTLKSMRKEIGKNVCSYLDEIESEKRQPNWCVMSMVRFADIKRDLDLGENEREDYLFEDLSMEVFVQDGFPDDKILIGYKGDEFEAGYFMTPYIPYTITPASQSRRYEANIEEGEDSFYLLLTRYGKKIMHKGSSFYGVLHLKSFVQ